MTRSRRDGRAAGKPRHLRRWLQIECLEPRRLLAGIQALHRSGQSFVTWQEDTTVTGETYHVYRHTEPITAANLDAATRLTQRWGPLAEGSSAYQSAREWPSPWDPQPIQRNFIIQDGGPELADTTGLFVWTTHESGSFYYAVTTVRGGVEDRTLVAGQDATATALVESVAAPAPVRVHTTASGRGAVFTQFMDYAAWNPTFDGYAYNYSIALPPGYDGSQAVPLMIYMQGWGGRYGVHDGSPYDFNSIWVEVDDPRQTWHYGFNADIDYRTAELPPTTGTIVNFTELRILQAIDEVSRLYNVDANRIHGHGSSMGGSGMLSLGLRYPNVFATVYAGLPMTDYAAADGSSSSTDWRSDLEPKWGTIAANLPMENRGPHAQHLAEYNGTGVWDWMDHQSQVVQRRGDESAYLCLAHTMQDDVIDWESQGQPVAAAFFAADLGFQLADVPGGHSWPGFEGSNEAMIGGDAGGGWGQFQFRRDLSFPAVSQASHSPPVPPPTSSTASYYYNLDIEWSVPWHDFGPAITDELLEYGITLRSTSGAQTADITPRRLQQFVVTPGARYEWTNANVATSVILQTGIATADAQGLLTIPGVQILEAGNRLAIRPQPGATLYVSPSGNDAAPGTVTEPLATVQHALNLAEPGTTILVRGGVYREWIEFPRSGTVDAPITVAGYPGETAILEGTGLEWRYGVGLGSHDHLRLENLTIRDYIRDGLRGYAIGGSGGNDDIVLRNLDFSLVGEGIKLQASDSATSHGILIEHVTGHDYESGGIDVGPAGSIDGLTLRQVTLAGPTGGNDTALDGIAVEDGQHVTLEQVVVTGHHGDGVDLKADHVVLRRVSVTGTGRDGIKLWGTDVLVENSLAMNTGLTALAITENAQVTARNSLFGNGVTGGYGYTIAVGDEAGPSGVSFTAENNVFMCANGNGGALMLLGEGTVFRGDYNLYFAPDRPATVVRYAGAGEFTAQDITDGDWSAAAGADAHALYGDPLLVDPLDGDFHLQSASPAVDYAPAGPAIDRDGAARPYGAAFDLGPFEWQGGTTGPSLEFPNTSVGIHVFSDQVPDGLSDAMLEFIASHYDGAQKMRTVFTDAVRAYNEHFIMLHYRLAVGHGQHNLLIDDDWASDWDDVNPHEDWFLHAASDPDARLRQVAWEWNLMDIDNAAWREYWLQSTIDQMRSVKAQGVFADSWDVAAYNADVLDPWDARFAGTAPRDNGWTDSLGELAQAMVAGLSAAPEDFLYLPNLGTLVTGWDDTDYSLADGGMVEGFGEWGAELQGEASDWNLQLNRVLDLAAQDKVLILQGTLRDAPDTPAGRQQRLFILGSYLLAKEDYTYVNILPPEGDLGAYYYPEYEADLGAATTAWPADVEDLLWNGVYRRDFEHGLVLVNAGDTPREIDLGGSFEMLVPSGGGAVSDEQIGADGSYQGGSVEWVAVTSLTLPVSSAAILRPAGTFTLAGDIFFLHQSTGQGIMEDHDGHPGLVSQLQALGHSFGDYDLWSWPPGGSVPTEIASLFADSNHDGQYGDSFQTVAALNGARDADVLMLKSCFYTLEELEDPANLARWEQAFIDHVAPYANQHPSQTLVVLPAVPLRAEAGLSAAAAARARDWAQWLAGDFITQYTTQANVASFDLFDFWADAESHPTNANALQRQYVRTDGDNHPNDDAYSAAADALAEFLAPLLPGVKATASGFVATFNAPLDRSVLNLFDGAEQTLGAADVTVVGATRGPVCGSLVASADRRQITFIKSGGLIEPDTYTVTLFSGQTRFRDAAGRLLDGDADGVAGDNFRTTWTVAERPAGTVTVSLPDFARGAGQPVNIPSLAAGLPIRLDDAAGVTSLSVDLVYDASLLSITAAALAQGVPGDWAVTLNTGTTGVARITAAGTTALAGTNLDVVRLTARVPNDAPYGVSQTLRLENVLVTGGTRAALGDVAVHKAAYLGDTDGSGLHAAADAFLVVQTALELASGFAAHAWTDPRIVGDVDGSGILSAADAFLIVQEGLGRVEPFVPDNPHIGVTPASGGVDPQFRIDAAIPAPAGGWVTVPVRLAIEPAATNAGGIDFDLFFAPDVLTINVSSGVSPGADTAAGWGVSATLVVAGQLRVGLVGAGGQPLAPGLREIARLQFSVADHIAASVPDAMPRAERAGDGVLDIEPVDPRAGGYTWTAVDGSLAFSASRARQHAADEAFGDRQLDLSPLEGLLGDLAHDLASVPR